MNELLGPSSLIHLSLNIRTDEQLRELFAGLRAMARGKSAMELAVAMLVAWLQRQDAADLGYLTFAAFCRERVDWNASWRRELRLAVRAEVAVDRQTKWLADVALDMLEDAPRELRVLEPFSGENARIIRDARRLARLCLGRSVTPREVDDYILRSGQTAYPHRRSSTRPTPTPLLHPKNRRFRGRGVRQKPPPPQSPRPSPGSTCSRPPSAAGIA